ncbi:hypothetical protein [Bradyrhizobium japonicum]|uniref:hypothetical protein n=1 Tax=Bradyrhizobium japonicum TaxID=375 RepID=UPI0013748057|nr:hypothetical protein [Bradyrhizobium japonicum]
MAKKNASKAKSPKSKKAKARKKSAAKRSALKVKEKLPKPPARLKQAARPKSERARRAFIEELKITSLHGEDIGAIVKHCEAVLTFRRTIGSPVPSIERAATSRCYEKAADSNIVNITDKDGNDYGETTQEDADARGIPPCG